MPARVTRVSLDATDHGSNGACSVQPSLGFLDSVETQLDRFGSWGSPMPFLNVTARDTGSKATARKRRCGLGGDCSRRAFGGVWPKRWHVGPDGLEMWAWRRMLEYAFEWEPVTLANWQPIKTSHNVQQVFARGEWPPRASSHACMLRVVALSLPPAVSTPPKRGAQRKRQPIS